MVDELVLAPAIKRHVLVEPRTRRVCPDDRPRLLHGIVGADELRADDANIRVRLEGVEQSAQRVAAHNAGEHSRRAGINQFSDLSDEEFKSKVLMRPQKCSATNTVGVPGGAENKQKPADLPPSIDWRSRGIVSEVKNQGADPVSSDRSSLHAVDA